MGETDTPQPTGGGGGSWEKVLTANNFVAATRLFVAKGGVTLAVRTAAVRTVGVFDDSSDGRVTPPYM